MQEGTGGQKEPDVETEQMMDERIAVLGAFVHILHYAFVLMTAQFTSSESETYIDC